MMTRIASLEKRLCPFVKRLIGSSIWEAKGTLTHRLQTLDPIYRAMVMLKAYERGQTVQA